jgi:hypothetical protein
MRMTKEDDSWNHSISTSSINTSSTRYLINFINYQSDIYTSTRYTKIELEFIYNEDTILNWNDFASLITPTYTVLSETSEAAIKLPSSVVLL